MRQRSRAFRRIAVAVALGAAWAAAAALDVAGVMPGFSPHRWSLDYLFPLRQELVGPIYDARQSPTAVIVIDEETYRTEPLAGLPQVAWTPQLATVLDAVGAAGAKVVGLDLVYPTTLENLIRGYDKPFRQAIARLGRTGRLILGRIDASRQPILPQRGQMLAVGGAQNVRTLQLFTDDDGVVRQYLGRYYGETTFVGELARRAGAKPPERFIINYNTGPQPLPVFGLGDIWRCAQAGNTRFLADAFKGRVVLVGTALDVEDRRIPAKRFADTPFAGPTARCTARPADLPAFGDSVQRHTIPGVFVHAAALNTILLGKELAVPAAWQVALGAFAFVGGLTLVFLSVGPALGLVVLALALCATVAASLAAMLAGLLLPMLTLILAALVSAALVYLVRFVEEMRARRRTEKAKRELTQRFGRYLAPAIIARLETDPEALRLGGDRRRVTVFFSDIVGYTSVSEALQARPELLVEVVNGYFTVMVDVIEQHGGYVDKFIGDAVMAVWGAPLPQERAEKRAVEAALACVAALERYNSEVVVGRHGLPPLGARIGVNTGFAIVGNMGSPARLNYTVTGDTVNLASRLEGANKAYGTTVMVGPETADAVADEFVLRQLDLLAVKGKKIPVRVYEVMGPKEAAAPSLLAQLDDFNAALALYAKRLFAEAEAAFGRLIGGDRVAALYADRCRHYLANPPPADWDGSFEMHEK